MVVAEEYKHGSCHKHGILQHRMPNIRQTDTYVKGREGQAVVSRWLPPYDVEWV